jgi:hypothetical protein
MLYQVNIIGKETAEVFDTLIRIKTKFNIEDGGGWRIQKSYLLEDLGFLYVFDTIHLEKDEEEAMYQNILFFYPDKNNG